jgi:hypothetical protein
MSSRVALTLLIALAAGGAATVPFAVGGLPVLTLDIPGLPASAADGHAGHGGHAGHATATPGKAPASAHAHGATADPDAASAGHGGHAASAPASDDGVGHEAHAAHLVDQPGMQRPAFPPAEGKVPASAEGLRQVSSLFIESDAGVEEAGFAIPGAGTLSDPYVLRGLAVTGELSLTDTDACFVVAENYIEGQLTLNWNGQCVWVHHNYVEDLRVNENNQRTGYATGGLIERNQFGILGQLRHFDGEFRYNTVGPFDASSLYDPVKETVLYEFLYDTRVANIDGFNQGLIHHNEFLGTVDLDFHGHHHGTGFFAPHSHYHGSSATRQKADQHDHTDRWTSVAFTDNLVVDPEGYGLRYEDQNHRGDDQTARSEDLDVLDEPHRHHTAVVLARNTVRGGQIWVDVFNAEDPKHDRRNPGTLTIADNTVEVHEREPDAGTADLCLVTFGDVHNPFVGLHVYLAQELEARIVGNTISYVPLPASADPVRTAGGLAEDAYEVACPWSYEPTLTAIRLEQLDDSHVLIQGNRARGFAVGVVAAFLDNDVAWRVVGNDFGKARAILYDDTVQSEPQTS